MEIALFPQNRLLKRTENQHQASRFELFEFFSSLF